MLCRKRLRLLRVLVVFSYTQKSRPHDRGQVVELVGVIAHSPSLLSSGAQSVNMRVPVFLVMLCRKRYCRLGELVGVRSRKIMVLSEFIS